jgi:hypothetical protein
MQIWLRNCLAAPEFHGEARGETRFKKYAAVLILFACSRQAAVAILGFENTVLLSCTLVALFSCKSGSETAWQHRNFISSCTWQYQLHL